MLVPTSPVPCSWLRATVRSDFARGRIRESLRHGTVASILRKNQRRHRLNRGGDRQAGLFSDLIGSVSHQSLSPPCTTGPNTIECGPPPALLQPGAILVEISHNGSPLCTIDGYPGTTTIVWGRPARVTDEAGAQGYCTGRAADRTRTEVIAFPEAPDNYFEIDICSRRVADAVGIRVMESIQVTASIWRLGWWRARVAARSPAS